jgi:hypothetical protein
MPEFSARACGWQVSWQADPGILWSGPPLGR